MNANQHFAATALMARHAGCKPDQLLMHESKHMEHQARLIKIERRGNKATSEPQSTVAKLIYRAFHSELVTSKVG